MDSKPRQKPMASPTEHMVWSHVKGLIIVDHSLCPFIAPLSTQHGFTPFTLSSIPMEAPQLKRLNGTPPAPAYEEFPSVPLRLTGSPPSSGDANAMDIDSHVHLDERGRRDTSVLSMDDIEAAQALEGLRAGKSRLW